MFDMEQSDGLDEWEDGESREPTERRPRRGGLIVGQKSPDSKVQGTERLQSGPETVQK